MIQCKWAHLLFNILHFQFWQVILTLESDAVVSVVCNIYFSSPNFRTSFIVREAAKVWPGNKSVHFKHNPTENLKLEELVSRLEEKCKIPKIGFERGKYSIHYILFRRKTTKENLKNRTSLKLFFIYFTIGTQICPKTDNHIRNVSGFQGVQGLFVVKIDLMTTQPTDWADHVTTNVKFMNHSWMNFICYPKSGAKFQPVHTQHMSPCPDPVKWIILHVFEYESQ